MHIVVSGEQIVKSLPRVSVSYGEYRRKNSTGRISGDMLG